MINTKDEEKSRTQNAVLNVFIGYLSQLGIVILSFIGRKIFLNYLSAEYLGINGLFSNILTVLSFAELGLDTALVYSLYQPVAEKKYDLVISLLDYFKKIYWTLAAIIFSIGIAIIPLFKYIVHSELPLRELIIYYVLILVNTVLSYFVAHKVAYISACQKQRLHKAITLMTNLVMQILHIIVLVIWRNYYFYLCATIVSTLVGIVVLNYVCDALIPKVGNDIEPVPFGKKIIISRITSTFLYKIGAVLVANTDNILISAVVSTVAVGLYSNYYTVISSVQSFLAILATALVSGIGNFAIKKGKKSQYELFNVFLLLYHFIATTGFIGFSLVMNDFIALWLGKQYLFDNKVVLIIAFNFYLTNIQNPVYIFREANGLFQQTKYIMLVRAFINLIMSYVLGIKYGIFGIFLATAISLLLTSFWFEPMLLFKRIMQGQIINYIKRLMKYSILTLISFFICDVAIKIFGSDILGFICKVVCISIVNILVFVIFNIKTEEFKKMKSYFSRGK